MTLEKNRCRKLNELMSDYSLNSYALSVYLKSEEARIDYYRNGTFDISYTHWIQFLRLITLMARSVRKALENAKEQKALTVPVIHYVSEEDFQEFFQDASKFQSVMIYRPLMYVIFQALRKEAFKPYIVEFDRFQYLNWLTSEGKENTSENCSLWVSLQPAT
ncbi:hypothetical protein NDI45_29000 [Leptolyngbya sp. GB1-A1]|uniref:hypothetical protein n=1 Tax=Leptolyngbya sp. GB1-A1 TaxID=2933908 RepID=UPI00329A72B4